MHVPAAGAVGERVWVYFLDFEIFKANYRLPEPVNPQLSLPRVMGWAIPSLF